MEILANPTKVVSKFLADLFRDKDLEQAQKLFDEVVSELMKGNNPQNPLGEPIAMAVEEVAMKVVNGVKVVMFESFERPAHIFTPPCIPYGGERRFRMKITQELPDVGKEQNLN